MQTSDNMRTHVAVQDAPAVDVHCRTCGATVAPDGACLNVGACIDADTAATRGAARSTAKYAVPAAWNVRGGVD